MTTNATSVVENVNSLLGLSRNDHTAMLDVFMIISIHTMKT